MMSQASLKRFFISVVLPSILAIALFIMAIFLVILPSFERAIMNEKKASIYELTSSVCSLVEEYQLEADKGLISEDSAKILAMERVRRIRYGDEAKDYFWIIDHQPLMIMHPYRRELVGTDLNNYSDPEGKMLFVEAVRIIEGSGEGFIDYQWQWKDDPGRIVPKLSCVQDVPEWGWIIGTGIYLEDVREEIQRLKGRLLRVSLLITSLITITLGFIIRSSLRIERQRRKAENALSLSREKYKSLVEASTEGTLMLIAGNFVYSNLKFSLLSGYDPSEVGKMKFEQLFDLEWERIEQAFSDPKRSLSREAMLRCKDESTKEVVLSASMIDHAGQNGFILIIKEVNASMQYAQESKLLDTEMQTSLSWMSRELDSFARDPLYCAPETTVRDAATLLRRKKEEVLFIRKDDLIIGYLTASDLLLRTIALGKDALITVQEIMNAPVLKLPSGSFLYEGLLQLNASVTNHLLLEDSDGNITGAVGMKDIAEKQVNQISFLLEEIRQAEGVEQLRRIYSRLPVLLRALIDSGSHLINLNQVLSSAADAIHRRLLSLNLESMGTPPCAFAFMVMGSQGRNEQSLLTDQDNAIIIAPPNKEVETDHRKWFLELGKRMNEQLARVGYRPCEGGIMAGNPQWNQDLESWKSQFSKWIRDSDPQSILDAAIFFDFKYMGGDEELVDELQAHVEKEAKNKAVFFYHMAQSVVKMKLASSISGELDLKKLQLPLATCLRLYALQGGIPERSSMARASSLLEKEMIDHDLHEQLVSNLEFLGMIRLRQQARSIARNLTADNLIKKGDLSKMEEQILKMVLSDLKGLQTRLVADFNQS